MMTNRTNESFWALVLVGGDGTRLHGLTGLIAGAPIPKQYCRILGPQSLLETTLWRIAPLITAERTLAIINRDHLPIAGEGRVGHVSVMMCTASAARRRPVHNAPDGKRNTELVAAIAQVIAEQTPDEIVWPGSHRPRTPSPGRR